MAFQMEIISIAIPEITLQFRDESETAGIGTNVRFDSRQLIDENSDIRIPLYSKIIGEGLQSALD
jgi:hypothetical protein